MPNDLEKLIDQTLGVPVEPITPSPSAGTAPVRAPELPTDPLEAAITDVLKPTVPTRTDSVTPPAVSEESELDKIVTGLTGPRAPALEKPGILTAATQSLERGIGQIRKAVPTLQGMYAESQGDTEGIQRYAAEAQQIEDNAAKPVVGGFTKIDSAEDLAYWAIETLGEQIPVLGATMLGAYVGGRALPAVAPLGLAVRGGYMTPQAAQAWSQTLGMVLGGSTVGIPLETADTADELYGATKSFHPGLSTAAGFGKGLLEVFTPLQILNRVTGRTVGSTISRAVARTALGEGLTELGQEEIGIMARKYADPSYDYFGTEAVHRRIDSFAAGTLVGGVVGGPAEIAGRKTEQKTGTQTEVPAEADKPAQSPVGYLKRMLPFLQTDFERDSLAIHAQDPFLDAGQIGALLGTFGRDWVNSGLRLQNELAFTEWMERGTKRYAVVDAQGQTRAFLNGTDLEQTLMKVPMSADVRNKVIEVNQQSLVPAGISAMLEDIPTNADRFDRIYFLPTVPKAQRAALLDMYKGLLATPGFTERVIQSKMTGQVDAELQGKYGQLLNAGLRVLPSPGSSFHYSGDFEGATPRKIEASGRTNGLLKTAGDMKYVFAQDAYTPRQARDFAVDALKLQPGDALAVGGDSHKSYKVPETWTPAQIKEMDDKIESMNSLPLEDKRRLEYFQELLDAGVTSAISPSHQALYLNRNIELARVAVPGNPETMEQTLSKFEDVYLPFPKMDTEIGIILDNRTEASIANETPEQGEIRTWITMFHTEVNGWLRAKGIAPALLMFKEQDKYGPQYDSMTGIIEIPFVLPSWLSPQMLKYAYLHELGHHITIQSLRGERSAHLEGIYQAYQRHTLESSMNPASVAERLDIAIDLAQQHKKAETTYKFTFAEYLAEQFVRWTFNEGVIQHPREEFFHRTGGMLTDLALWLDKNNQDKGDTVAQATARLEVDYTFAKYMEALFQMEEVTVPLDVMPMRQLDKTQVAQTIRQVMTQVANDATTSNDVPNFIQQWTTQQEGNSVTIDAAFRAYQEWAAQANITPITLELFQEGLNDLGILRQRIAGQDRLIGRVVLPLEARPVADAQQIPVAQQEANEKNVNELTERISFGQSFIHAVQTVLQKISSMLTTDPVVVAQQKQLETLLQAANENKIGDPISDNIRSLSIDFTSIEMPDVTKNKNKLNSILEVLDHIIDNPVVEDFEIAANKALEEMKNLLPEGWAVDPTNKTGYVTGDEAGAAIPSRLLIVLGTGAMRLGVGNVLMHEIVHAVRATNLFKPEEWSALVRETKKDARLWRAVRAGWTEHYRKMGEKLKVNMPDAPADFVDAFVQDKLEEEAVAIMTGLRYAGASFIPEVNSLLDRLLEFLRKLKGILNGQGYVSPEDVRRRLFRGEISTRQAKEETWKRWDKLFPAVAALGRAGDFINPDKIVQVADDAYIAVEYTNDRSAIYRMYKPPTRPLTGTLQDQINQLGTVIGAVYLHKNAKGWEVDMVKMRKSAYEPGVKRSESFSATAYRFIEQDKGIVMRPSATLLDDGYKMWQKRDPQSVRYHVRSNWEDMWFSPNYIKMRYDYLKYKTKAVPGDQAIKEDYKHFAELYNKVPKEAWRDPELEKMFSLGAKDYMYGTAAAMVQQEMRANENYLNGTNVPPVGVMEVMKQKRDESQRANAKRLGVPFEMGAPEQPEIMPMRNLLRGAGLTPQQMRALGTTVDEADRITWFSKRWWGIHQLAWANPNIIELQDYTRTIESWIAMREQWVAKADAVAKRWDQLRPLAQREKLADLLFYMTEMRYLSANERRRKVVRQPTQQEKQQAYVSFGLNAEAQALHAAIEKSFDDFLVEMENVSRASIQREFVGNPTGMHAALVELAADMAAMRMKPYFPMTRFGEWTLTVKDPTSGKTEAFYTFESEREQRDYILVARAQYQGKDLSIGRIPTQMQEYISLPGPLLKRIKTTLPNITPLQKTWLDQLEHQTAPERSFRKHWMTRQGTPGYSLDAFRVYSNYFNTGAGYLARLRYKDEAQHNINLAVNNAKKGKIHKKRFQIIDEMQLHLNYMLEAGRDHSKLRAFAAMFHLGFSPAAAAMNLTQLPVYTIPYLSNIFGASAAKGAFTLSVTALKATVGGVWQNAPWPGYEKARQEMINIGKIDAGQAPELGAYASSNNLTRTAAGDTTQRAWRQFSSAAMWMFSKTERFNREITFATAFKLAMDAQQSGKPNKYLSDLFPSLAPQILDLISRVGLTQEEAIAFYAARDAIDRTHFVYAPWARPRFMRNSHVADVLVFFMYTTSALYALRHNPGRIKSLLVMLTLYGMMGMPFANDLDKIVEALARRWFSKDWSPKGAARELIVSLTKGTVGEKVGADLFLHGISRFGFGPGMLPEGWGAPRFDASANGSMGNIIPVVPDMIKGWGHYGKFKEIIGEAAQKGAGAGYGYFFALLQLLSNDPHTAGYKKWEAVMQREMKALSKAGRYAITGVEKNNSGAVIARFNVNDPDDVATLLTQALGFSPTKLNQRRELTTAQKESEQFYDGWKKSLYAQLDAALQADDQKVVDDVLRGIQQYNAEVIKQGFGTMVVKPQQMLSSIKNRSKNRVKEEEGLPTRRSSTPLYQQLEEQYPLLERKPVR